MDRESQRSCRVSQKIAQIRADRLSEPNVRRDAVAEKRVARAFAGPIVELRRQHHVSRCVLLLQTADRRHRNNPPDIQRSKRVNIGPVIYFVRQNPVAAAMPRQKINLTPA